MPADGPMMEEQDNPHDRESIYHEDQGPMMGEDDQ
jgi:hypothetical protein